MAMGDSAGGSSQNNNNRVFDNTYYSRQKVNYLDEGLTLGFSFSRGLLSPTISSRPKNYGDKGEILASVNLSQTKASILAQKAREFLTYDKSDTNIYGIDTGIGETRGFIGFQNNPDGSGRRTLLIGKIDADGTYTGMSMNFHDNQYYTTLKIHDMESMKFEKEHVAEDFELKQFIELLEDFSRASNGAYAYASADLTRYDTNKQNNTLNLIAEAMNINTKMNNSGSKSSSPSYFDKNQGANSSANTNRGRSEHMSADEVDNMLG